MPSRLPLEPELMILELAAPPLAFDRLHARVAFFINVSLVHRSLTAWAQDRLRDQFLYTYGRRSDEHERLKTRFEAGFGRDQPLSRLYLDLSRLPSDIIGRTKPGTDSVAATMSGRVYGCLSSVSQPGKSDEAGEGAREQACEAVAHFVYEDDWLNGHWELCAMITSYSQALDTLWLKLPYVELNIQNLRPPRVLYLDKWAANGVWGLLGMLPLASETVLVLRNIYLCAEGSVGDYDTRHMIFHGCWATEASLRHVLDRFSHLETLVLFETAVGDLVSTLVALPAPIRRVHILDPGFGIGEHRPIAPRVLPQLDSFTYTLVDSWESESQSPADDEPAGDTLAEVQQAVESILDAPQCTFKYARSTRSPEDAQADALAAFKLDS